MRKSIKLNKHVFIPCLMDMKLTKRHLELYA